jgi:Protein of unknown function (DUF2934)
MATTTFAACGCFRSEWCKEFEMQRPAEMDIVRRAYELWEQAAKPDGRDQEFYHQAEQELQKASEQAIPEQPR